MVAAKFLSQENEIEVGSAEIGYIDFQRGRIALLDSVFIQKEYRGQGRGRKLVEKCIEWAKTQNCDAVELTVSTRSVEARKLYEDLGFYDRSNNAMRLAINPRWGYIPQGPEV